jgi:DNA-binding MarR family transcriptional regulator
MARRRNAANSDHATPADINTVGGGAPLVRRVPLPLARHFFQICTAASAETVAGEGLKSGQFAILAHLSRKTGEPGIDQTGIAARMGVDRARVSQLMEELEAMGLVDRRVNGADRRARVLRLTPRGEQLRARLQPAVLADQMRVLAPLAPRERELFLDLLVRVIDANRALTRPDKGAKRGARQSPSNIKSRSAPSNRT